MNRPRSALAPLAAWVQICGLLFIMAGMLLAEGAAILNFAGKLALSATAGPILRGGAIYLVLAGTGLLGLRWIYRRRGPGAFLLTVLLGSLAIQCAAIALADQRWTWTGDAQIFRQYLSRLSATGYSPETLGALSDNYDYRVWTRRAQPFYYLLARGTGAHFVLAVQLFQALLIAGSLALLWRIARLAFGRKAAFWATSLQFLMPFRGFICLDLNHHVLGGFYYLTGLWLLAEWMRPNRPRRHAALLLICAGALLPLMKLEGGIDTVYLASTLLVLLLAWAAGRQNAGAFVRGVGALLAWPLLVSALLVSPLIHRIDQADLHRHESGPVAFMARGWAPESGGEYCYTYELIDYLTPAERKTPTLGSLLASQAYYNPRVLLGQLLPIKCAKYFLLGYASGAEELLAQNGARRAEALAEGARTAFLLIALPGMIWGGLLLLPMLRSARRLTPVLPCALICATYVLLGETSPRYSIYIQPFLFMLAALPLAWGSRRRRRLLRGASVPGLVGAISLAAAWLAAAGLLGAGRNWLQRHSVQDLRTWTALPESQRLDLAPTLAPFEIRLAPRPDGTGTAWGGVQIPAPPPGAGALSFYAFPAEPPAGSGAQPLLVAEYADGVEFRTQTNSLPGRIRMTYPDSTSGEVRFRSPAAVPFPLRLGYATYEPHEKTTE